MSERRLPPLLFLDVDGTLIPTAGVQLPTTLEDWDAIWQHPSNPHLAAIDITHGDRLRRLPCEIVWATAWMHDANRVIAPLMGFPDLPVAEMGALPSVDDPTFPEDDDTAPLSWKVQALVALAAGRPFAWVDDELTDVDRDWVAANHDGAALLHRVDCASGLTADDLVALESWFESLG